MAAAVEVLVRVWVSPVRGQNRAKRKRSYVDVRYRKQCNKHFFFFAVVEQSIVRLRCEEYPEPRN